MRVCQQQIIDVLDAALAEITLHGVPCRRSPRVDHQRATVGGDQGAIALPHVQNLHAKANRILRPATDKGKEQAEHQQRALKPFGSHILTPFGSILTQKNAFA